jgi:hypothetical protein
MYTQPEARFTFTVPRVRRINEGCRKGAKFAEYTAFSGINGEISSLLSMALCHYGRFRGGSFQPLTHLSGKAVVSTQLPENTQANEKRSATNGAF